MDNYFLYVHEEPKTDDWGVHIPTCGYQQTFPGETYPLPGHPLTHTFSWQIGRELKDCYLVYIPTGIGKFETKSKRWTVNPGDLMVLAPEEWHRYKPIESTGWEEYWIGFRGGFLSNRILGELLPTGKSYIKHLGFQEELIFLFNKSFELAKGNSQGYRKILAGIIMQLVGYVVFSETEKPESREEQLSKKVISYIRKHSSEVIDFQKLADEHHLSYNRFRTIFKNETGESLQQYLIQERLKNAKELIINTNLSLKEISAKTGFGSSFYFSKVFKNEMGYPPGQIRTKSN